MFALLLGPGTATGPGGLCPPSLTSSCPPEGEAAHPVAHAVGGRKDQPQEQEESWLNRNGDRLEILGQEESWLGELYKINRSGNGWGNWTWLGIFFVSFTVVSLGG